MSNLISAQDAGSPALEKLPPDEAHELPRLLQLVAAEGLDELSEESSCSPGRAPHVFRRAPYTLHAGAIEFHLAYGTDRLKVKRCEV
ncbi:hypothetical protein [Streptomyces sp. NPDC102360]|uniref:hypothetical protein n=1 Tax=Streptomyces sp. NPDC102360 TaxID=3366160 RepID=UPI00381D4E93